MLAKLNHLLGKNTTRPVFVVGTGRSGTHWLGYSLANHPGVRATVEKRPMFKLSTQIALNPALEGKLFGRLVRAYKWQLLRSAPKLYVDKTHPNLWIAERLKEAFPQSLFVGIERNPFATVASMMKHQGVSAWHERWREFPLPNRFLGITQELAEEYAGLPIASKCALRWVAHHQRMNQLKGVLGEELMVISYEDFIHNTELTIRELTSFLGLHEPLPVPEVKTASLLKWRAQLTEQEVLQIGNVVGSVAAPAEHLPARAA